MRLFLACLFDPERTTFKGSWHDWSIEGRHDQPEGGYRWTGRKTG